MEGGRVGCSNGASGSNRGGAPHDGNNAGGFNGGMNNLISSISNGVSFRLMYNNNAVPSVIMAVSNPIYNNQSNLLNNQHVISKTANNLYKESSSCSTSHSLSASKQSVNSGNSSGFNPDSLLDICAKVVAKNVPFQTIEEKFPRIPEPVQRRLVFWSFPRNERDIKMYSCFSSQSTLSGEIQGLPYYRGLRLVDLGAVQDVLQVGFHLSGTVICNRGTTNNTSTNNSSNNNSNNNSPQNNPDNNNPQNNNNNQDVAAPQPPSTTSANSGNSTSTSTSTGANSTSTTSSSTIATGSNKYRVSISFDRCKITSVTCSCETRDIFWCPHVVALSLYRIRHSGEIQLRIPISETLLQMDRQQLQKLVQYLISEHHTTVLPTAQKLADQILQPGHPINRIQGAPDPTAGNSADEEHCWHLDSEQVKQQVSHYLSQSPYCTPTRQLYYIFTKVREMIRARDSNGPKMLQMITEQFLNDPRLLLWKTQGTPMNEKCRHHWDAIAAMWGCVVLSPHSTEEHKLVWKKALTKWGNTSVCPLEDPDSPHTSSSRRAAMQESSTDSSEEDEMVVNNNNRRERRDRRHSRRQKRRRLHPPSPSIFQRAIDACELNWDDPHLQSILMGGSSPSTSYHKSITGGKKSSTSSTHAPFHLPSFSACKARFNSKGQPLWTEPISVACGRVDALRSHGYRDAAVRLAVCIARTLKHIQCEAVEWWEGVSESVMARCSGSGWCRWLVSSRSDGPTDGPPTKGWIGDPCDPITTLFDCLAEASLVPEDVKRFQYHNEWHGIPSEDQSSSPLRFRHNSLPDSVDRNESYLTLALESALIGLGQHRLMPQGLYLQEKARKQEEKLIMKLHELTMDSSLVGVLKRQAHLLQTGGPFSGLGEGVCPEAVPLHTFSKFMFNALLAHNADQAYKLALRGIRLPILEDQMHEEPNEEMPPMQLPIPPPAPVVPGIMPLPPNAVPLLERVPGPERNNNDRDRAFVLPRSTIGATRWYTLSHIETQQCSLACAVISAAANDVLRLRAALDASLRNIHSSTHLFKLAQDAFRLATPQDGLRNTLLLNAALELGLQVLRLTLTCVNWRRREMVRWLVTCATEVGVAALMSIMQGWYALFTPPEAVAGLASTIMAHNTVMRLSLDRQQQDELAAVARTLALQCATKDPPNCALNALTLCEGDPVSFEAAYQVVVDAASNAMSSSQLFAIARYMEHRGHPTRAYTLAILAMQSVHISYAQDSHPAIADILWAVALAHQLGRNQLAQLLPIFVKNVQCATVLSDVLRRCSIASPGGPIGPPPPPGHGAGNPLHHPPPPSHDSGKRRSHKTLAFDKPPLRGLLDATILSYINTTNSRLTHISPRHYQDFIDFLTKAHETFMLAPDGRMQFGQLIENMKVAYKGKKKLMSLVRERFG